MEDPISQPISIRISSLAELIIRSSEKVRFDGDESAFKEIRDALLIEERRVIHHPIYHLEFCPDIEYVSAQDDKTRKGVWYLWRKSDWELSEIEYRKRKVASDLRVEGANNCKAIFDELCIGIAKAFGSKPDDDLVTSLASVITLNKNKTMCEFYGVKQETMDKVWNV